MNTWKWKDMKVPVKSWCPEPERGAIEQINHAASLPMAFHHVSLMPDAHQGFGVPIGGVVALKNAISPALVGVDIGCGMCALATPIQDLGRTEAERIVALIKELVPVGFAHHTSAASRDLMPQPAGNMLITLREFDSARYQLGTLGGGNHFIELQRDPDGHLWIMIHSGSRNLGKQVADYYSRVAANLNSKWHTEVPAAWQLAFLPLDSDEGHNYLREMNYCVDFALANRKRIMEFVIEAIKQSLHITLDPAGMINIAHNYAAMENHFGENVMVHRKGATKAAKDLIGIIPGSQGTCSYIVKGLGNPDSFESCSHGAGRKMGRADAKRRLNLEDEIALMDAQGIVHGIRSTADLDEAAGAYKTIDEVMENQKDLVVPVTRLTPLAVVKG
jgi:tRNA-splicing ligase RtcB (3'-phosphate/5'-hydroxy nucleic acid ligase)